MDIDEDDEDDEDEEGEGGGDTFLTGVGLEEQDLRKKERAKKKKIEASRWQVCS